MLLLSLEVERIAVDALLSFENVPFPFRLKSLLASNLSPVLLGLRIDSLLPRLSVYLLLLLLLPLCILRLTLLLHLHLLHLLTARIALLTLGILPLLRLLALCVLHLLSLLALCILHLVLLLHLLSAAAHLRLLLPYLPLASAADLTSTRIAATAILLCRRASLMSSTIAAASTSAASTVAFTLGKRGTDKNNCNRQYR
ncbi:MAG: hypothetical protein ABI481_07245 [Pyrinomonadaceae bacterium]